MESAITRTRQLVATVSGVPILRLPGGAIGGNMY